RLHRLHHPRPVRGRLRARLRGAVPEPALRRRPAAGGLHRGRQRVTMHRRPLGRGRTLAATSGPLMVIACVLPWWKVGGTPGITQVTGNGLDGSGILVFLVGLATMALVVLPYAAGARPLGLARPLSFAILSVAGWIGFVWAVIQLALRGA